MEVTYINANGERLALRQARPFFLTRAEGLGRTRQTILARRKRLNMFLDELRSQDGLVLHHPQCDSVSIAASSAQGRS